MKLTGPHYDTRPGMAHFAGTGPIGTTCRQCRFWAGNSVEHHGMLQASTTRRWWKDGGPHPQACWKYRRLRRAQDMHEERSRRIAHHTPSCSHFEPADNAQPLTTTRPKKETQPAAAEGSGAR